MFEAYREPPAVRVRLQAALMNGPMRCEANNSSRAVSLRYKGENIGSNPRI